MRLSFLVAGTMLAAAAGLAGAQEPGRPGRDTTARRDSLARDTLGVTPVPLDSLRRDTVPELDLVLNARLESRAERARDETCSRNPLFNVSTSCQSFFQPIFDFQFDVRGSGTVAERFHVDVNYDSQREFDASNQLSARYEGRPGEFLQRVEVGNVFFALPPSRYIAGTVPSGNYGVQAVAQLGPWQLRGIAAQQKGNVVQDRAFTVGARTRRAVERTLDDYEVEPRRFFFTVDPARFGARLPNVDILDRAQMAALAASLPDEVRPVRVNVYRLRLGGRPPNPNGPQFRLNGIPTSRRGEIYEPLREHVDYYMDPSQLWFALVRPLSLNERLVVAYTVRVNGVETTIDSIGGTPDLAFTERDQVANLVWDPTVLPGDPAFRREIRSVYRVGGPDVLRETVTATIVAGTAGDQEQPVDGRAATYLELFGLAQRTNPARFDVENRLWPRPADPNAYPVVTGVVPGALDPAGSVIRDRFIVFPSLEPFATEGLAGSGGNPTNDAIYSIPSEDLYSERRPSARYRLRLAYETAGGEAAGEVSLGAVQLRQQSERVWLDGRPLERGRDYEIDYDLGILRLLDPALLLVPRRLVVRFEENPVFTSIPTSVYGAAAELPLEQGRLTFTALGQRQRSSFTRPPLGFEPAGILLAGMAGSFAWDAPALARFADGLPGARRDTTRAGVSARVSVSGELATSRPWNDGDMQAYLESFEGGGGLQPSLSEVQWYLSSQPAASPTLDAAVGAATLDLERAATLAWQSNGRTANGQLVSFSLDQIDPDVQSVGSGFFLPEPALWLTMHPLRVGGIFRDGLLGAPRWTVPGAPEGRRWRSLRTRLGASGADLTRTEAVEFWTLADLGPGRGGHNPTLVLDFGDISENTVAVAPESLLVVGGGADTLYRGRTIVGLDTLDSELDPFTRTFNQARDDRGLPGDVSGRITVVAEGMVRDTSGILLCRRGTQQVFRLGDPLASCTVANSRADTEDLDDDGVLNLDQSQRQAERIRRWVVRLDDPARRVRTGRCGVVVDVEVEAPGRNLCWVLIRLPWEAPDDSLNGGPLLRRVRAMRVTVVAGPDQENERVQVPLVRLRLAGAPWTKRDDHVVRGLAGEQRGTGRVVAALVGTQDRGAAGLAYEPPPGVIVGADTRLTGAEGERRLVTESSLRLLATELAPYERAEAFYRFPEGERSTLGYRELRLWARGRGPGWGTNGALQLFVKLGRDGDNFYLYRTPVQGGDGVAAWEPEIRVDLRRFSRLRGQLQRAFLENGPRVQCSGVDSALVAATPALPGGRGETWAACDEGYMVVTADPLTLAPNLAAVQELAVGMVRVDDGSAVTFPPGDTLEVWVNELRLANVNRTAGYAGQVELSVDAGDLGGMRLLAGRRDPYFRQLGQAPSFLADDGVELSATLNAHQLLPASFGLAIPLTLRVGRTATDPLLVSGADYAADDVEGLRTPATTTATWLATLRRREPATGRFAPLLNGLSASASYTVASARSEFRTASVRDATADVAWEMPTAPRTTRLPGWLRGAIASLPDWLERATGLGALRRSPVRWSPSRLRLATGLATGRDRRTTFLLPASGPGDPGSPVGARSRLWRSEALVELRPWAPLALRWDLREVRDLRRYGDDTSAVTRALDEARTRLLGLDVGVERERSMGASIELAPTTGWVRPRVTLGSRYDALRDPNRRDVVLDQHGDSLVPRRLGGERSMSAGVVVDVAQRVRADSVQGVLGLVGARLLPFDVTWTRTLRTAFDGTAADPDLGWQLGFGGMSQLRLLQGDLATFAAQSAQLSASGGVALPLGATATVRWTRGRGRNFTRQALPEQRVDEAEQVTFPDVALRWSWRPEEGDALVQAVSLDARWLETRQVGVARAEAAALRETRVARTRGWPLSASVTWAPGQLVTRVAWTRGERVDSLPGTELRTTTEELSADAGRAFALPPSWNLRSGLRTRLGVQHTRAEGFAEPFADPSARSRLVDNGRTAVSLSADTDVAENLTFVLQGSRIVTFDENLNRRLVQTLLSAALQLQFYAGELR